MSVVAKVLGSRPGVLNLHLDTNISHGQGDHPKMTMLYKINSGPVQAEHYGLNLAKVVGFPDSFIDIAEAASKELQHQIDMKRHNSQHQKLTRRRALILNLNETLWNMAGGDMDDVALGSFLAHLHGEFLSKMVEIEACNEWSS